MSQFYDQASLVMIPSGYKDGKLYSQKPLSSSGELTFSRGSDIEATRVASNGFIQKAAVNLLLQSNSYDTTWTQQNTTLTSGQSGYDGSSDAWKVESTTTDATRLRQTSSIAANTVVTLSVYAKVGNVNFIKFLLAVSGTNSIVTFDLTDGTTYASNDIDTAWEEVGNGWVRISATFINADIITETRIEVRSDYNDAIADAGSYVYIQDAQLEYGLVAQDYVETTTTSVVSGITNDMPRLDYSGGASCPSLLLEPSRQNLATHSEFFGAWTKAPVSITITDNAAISPEGVQNAAYVQFTGGNQYIRINTSGSSATYTGSVYIKGTAGETIQLAVAGVDSGLKTLTGGWDRIESTQTGASTYFLIHTFGGATARNIYTYGAQVEQGSYPTSYIPTYGTSATRTSESCSKTGISSLIGQTEGTIFAEFEIPQDFTSNEDHRFSISDGGAGNWIFVSINNIENIRVFHRTNNISNIDANVLGVISHGTTYKVAFAYKSGSSSCYLNGTEIISSSATLLAPSANLNQIALTGDSSTTSSSPQVFGLNLKQRLQFKTRLSNADLATLTTL